jgi:hypothetical protein
VAAALPIGVDVHGGRSLRRSLLPRGQALRNWKAGKTNAIMTIKSIAHKLARAVVHVHRDQKQFDPTVLRTFQLDTRSLDRSVSETPSAGGQADPKGTAAV